VRFRLMGELLAISDIVTLHVPPYRWAATIGCVRLWYVGLFRYA